MANLLLRLLCCAVLLLSGSAVWAGTDDSRYQRTVLALQTAEPTDRQRFASIALFELAGIYLAEADLARVEAESSDDGAKLISWSRAVSRYAEGLFVLLEEAEQGALVNLRLNNKEVPSIAIDGRTVMLAHPRRDQQAVYEQGVLAEFCTGNICSELTAQEELEPIPVTATTIMPEWNFSTDGLSCLYRGLQVSFQPGGQMAAQKALCRQLMQEAEMLATEIAWQQRHEVNINWDDIRIKPTPGRTAHLVSLNEAGDSLLLTLPLTYSSPNLLPVLTPWLQQRFLAEGPGLVEINAIEQGWD